MFKKLGVTALLLIALLMIARAGDVTIFDNGVESLSMEDLPTQLGGYHRIRVKAHVPKLLNRLQTVQVMCFSSDDNGVIADGAPAFAMQWLCMAPTCHYNYEFGAYLFSGSADVSTDQNGLRKILWSMNKDMTNDTFFTLQANDAYHLDTTFEIPFSAYVGALPIPIFCHGSTADMMCKVEFGMNYYDVNLLTPIDVTYWAGAHFDGATQCPV